MELSLVLGSIFVLGVLLPALRGRCQSATLGFAFAGSIVSRGE